MQKLLYTLLVVLSPMLICAQSLQLSGRVIDAEEQSGVGFSYVSIPELSLWATTDADGYFSMHNVSSGINHVVVQCLGYEASSIAISLTRDSSDVIIPIRSSSLKLDDVIVVAERKDGESSTSYSINKMALDHQQIVNLSSVLSLLPGGKTVNDNLVSDNRVALRSESLEKGNASFGTAIMVDGVRIDNNAMMSETMAASTRSIASSDIESVDVITGIPSVEYGDLCNGVVKVNLLKGKTPLVIDGKINQNTTQGSVNKGVDFGNGNGVLNVSYEFARSFKDVASPYTSYKRNILSLRYNNTLYSNITPISISMDVTGNLGGYDAKQDPDNNLDSYSKAHDNVLRASFEGNVLLNKSWITNLSLKANAAWRNQRTEDYTNMNSSSSQPYIHATEQGYHVASESADGDIVLGPVGYWYVRKYVDQKPVSINAVLKGDWSRRVGQNLLSKLLVGADISATGNNGKGIYYDDMTVAPTWRPYRYDELPWMYNLALYAEEKLTQSFGANNTVVLSVGLRDDMTHVPQSSYSSVGSLSPRFSGRYEWNGDGIVSNVTLHAGWGRSVKLPSFQVLYPKDSYDDILTFTPGSTADNKAYYAYYTHVVKSVHNDNLHYQYTNQTDIGAEMKISKARLSLSYFSNITHQPYLLSLQYTPFEYNYTSQSALEDVDIPVEMRCYSVVSQTGVVTVSGNGLEVPLASTRHRTYTHNDTYVNGNTVKRSGLEWIVEAPVTKWLSVRLDGNYYYYRGVDYTGYWGASSASDYAEDEKEPIIGYYIGSNTTSASVASNPTVSNGHESRKVNNNISVTLHVPQARIVVAIKAEATFLNYSRQLSVGRESSRGTLLANAGDVFGTDYNGEEDHYVAVYPEYYATWSNPDKLIPFAASLSDARGNDKELYQQLIRLIIRSNTSYYFNANRISPYCSFNMLVTKEIGNHTAISFYANNFLNTMRSVHSSQTNLDSSLFDSIYVPKYYYGLSLKIKI